MLGMNPSRTCCAGDNLKDNSIQTDTSFSISTSSDAWWVSRTCFCPPMPPSLERPFPSSVFSTFNRASDYDAVQPNGSEMNRAKSITYGVR